MSVKAEVVIDGVGDKVVSWRLWEKGYSSSTLMTRPPPHSSETEGD
jgi:hypothetical protein